MSSTSDNFIKINGEYVKFYASTNSYLPRILRNTGALVVTQEDEPNAYTGTERLKRSLFLANNFIASGYGFLDSNERQYIESYTYVREDGIPVLSYLIDGIKTDIITTNETFSYYVKMDGGLIDNTHISAYNNGVDIIEIPASYLTKMLKPAQYKDIEVYDESFWLEYKLCNLLYENNIADSTSDFKNFTTYGKFTNGSVIFDLPYGAVIPSNSFIYQTFKTINNDMFGFSYDGNSYKGTEDVQANVTHYWNETKVNEEVKISYIENEIENINIPIWHTDSRRIYKDYPNLQGLTSYENVITDYDFSFGPYKYNSKPILLFNVTSHALNYYREIYNKLDNNWVYIDDNVTFKMHNNGTYVYLSLPINYEITKCNIIKKYTRNGRNSYFKYNITGDVYELNYNDEQATSTYMFMNSYMYIKCKNYVIDFKNKYQNSSHNIISSDDYINLELRKTDDTNIIELTYFDDSGNYLYNTNNSNLNYSISVSSYFLQDSEFNSNHWFNVEELSYIEYATII